MKVLERAGILIIEDESKTASYLLQGLSENGFAPEVAARGDVGLRLALAGEYAAIVLDVMLPGMSGWDVLGELRRANVRTPVLFLTARDEVPDRVKGLELGADDYLVKPFAFAELLARLRSLIRRAPVHSDEILRVGDLEIDRLNQRVSRGGKRLDLTPKEFQLLLLLALRAGEVVPRNVIAERVWDIDFDTDTNAIDVAVRRLRRKVDDPFSVKLVHTVRGLGYLLEV